VTCGWDEVERQSNLVELPDRLGDTSNLFIDSLIFVNERLAALFFLQGDADSALATARRMLEIPNPGRSSRYFVEELERRIESQQT